jgi:hypothetical protein
MKFAWRMLAVVVSCHYLQPATLLSGMLPKGTPPMLREEKKENKEEKQSSRKERSVSKKRSFKRS